MSAVPLTADGFNYTYDFTTSAGQVYGGAVGCKEIAAGIWGMVGSDGNSNGQVSNNDKNDIWLPTYTNNGYLKGDFDMNGNVYTSDKTVIWYDNAGKACKVPQ